jgi:hypothetical protein
LLVLLPALAQADGPKPLLADGFERALDPDRWEVVRVNDARSDKIEAGGGRLLVALETIGADDRTVKVRGVRSREAFSLGSGPLRFGAAVDWNSQANGCYLSAGFALVPESYGLDKDPREAPEGLYFEWIGVPPGKSVRPYLARRHMSALVELYTEGWPQPKREDRVGRAASKAKVSLEVGKDSVRLLEGEKELFKGKDGLSGKFRLELFVSGHSNYPLRTVHFLGAEVAEVRSGS